MSLIYIFKMSRLSKVVCRLNATPIIELKNTLEFMLNYESLQVSIAILKRKNTTEDITIHDLKFNYRAIVTRAAWCKNKVSVTD